MSETLKSCVVSGADGRRAYECAADHVAFILTVPNGNKHVNVLIKMRPYSAKRILELKQDQTLYIKPVREEFGATEFERGSIEVDAKFFDEHFISASIRGQQLTQDQFDRLDAKYALRVNAVNVGLNEIKTDIEDADNDAEFSIEDLLSDSARVKQYVHFADEDGVEQRIDFDHSFRNPTAADSLAWGKTSKTRTLEGGAQRIAVNHGSRVKLYDEMILSVAGILVNGATCEALNKAAWIGQIPVNFKLAALFQVLGGRAFRKNV